MDVCLKDFFRPDERPRFQSHLRTEVNAFATDCIGRSPLTPVTCASPVFCHGTSPSSSFSCAATLTYIDYDGEVRVHKGRTKG